MLWIVTVIAEGGPNGLAGEVTPEQLRRFVAVLDSFSASVKVQPHQTRVEFTEIDHVDANGAIGEALRLFSEASVEVGLPNWSTLSVVVQSREPVLAGIREHLQGSSRPKASPAPIVGVTEASKILGVTKQRLSQLAERSDFPSAWRLAAGPFWLRSEIEDFERKRPRRSGRPPKNATMLDEQQDMGLSSVQWQKSSLSGQTGCVEVGFVEGAVAVRDSKDASGPVLLFTPSEWMAFLHGVRNGEFGRSD